MECSIFDAFKNQNFQKKMQEIQNIRLGFSLENQDFENAFNMTFSILRKKITYALLKSQKHLEKSFLL